MLPCQNFDMKNPIYYTPKLGKFTEIFAKYCVRWVWAFNLCNGVMANFYDNDFILHYNSYFQLLSKKLHVLFVGF